MIEQEAIRIIRHRIDTARAVCGSGKDGKAFEDLEMAIEALKKQIPKKPIIKPTTKKKPITHNLGRLLEVCCPVCGKSIFAIYESDLERGCGLVEDVKGCSRCLQAINLTEYYAKRNQDKMDEDIVWEEGETK